MEWDARMSWFVVNMQRKVARIAQDIFCYFSILYHFPKRSKIESTNNDVPTNVVFAKNLKPPAKRPVLRVLTKFFVPTKNEKYPFNLPAKLSA